MSETSLQKLLVSHFHDDVRKSNLYILLLMEEIL